MTDRSRDVRVRILSEYYDEGSRAAERATRRLANQQIAANREDIAREAQRAAAVVQANMAQSAAMESFGRRTMAVSAVVAIGLGLTAKAAMDWQSAWAGVTKTVDGSPEEMARLADELRGLALVLPATHEEIAGVAEAAGQLGVKRADIADFTRTMIDMGETTNLSSQEAATGIAQLSNIMGIGADKADRLGSTIVALGNDGASTERDILSMALRIAGAGRTVGLTSDEVLAMASTLSSLGIEAEAGGTAISRVMLQIDKDVSTSSDTVEQYARVAGLSAQEFAAKWKTDAAGALDLFTQGLGKMQAAGQNTTTALDEMGFSEVRVSDALRRLALSGDLNSRSLETSSQAWRENNALAEEAAKRYETAEARLQIARNQINDAAIDIGGNFLPALATAGEAVGSLAVGFGALDPAAQSWVTGLGAAAAGLGTVVGGAAIAIPKLVELRKTIDDLHGGSSTFGKALGGTASFLTGPWGLAIAGATLAAGYWLKTQGETKQRVDALTASLDEQTGAITENTRSKTINRLEERGTLDDARQLGLELDVVTDAALGNAAAQNQVTEALAALEAQEIATGEAHGASGRSTSDQLKLIQDVARDLTAQNHELADGREEWELRAEAMGTAEVASDAVLGSTELLTAELGEGEQAAQNASTAIDELATMLDDLNGPTLSARDAERAWYEQLEQVTVALQENGTTLDITTAAGRANQEVLDGLARSGAARATALLQETGSIEQYNASLEASRQALFDNALQFFGTEEAAWDYVDSVLAIPDTSTTQAILDTTAAEAKLAEFKRILASNNFVINAELRTSNPYYTDKADGGVLEFYRSGGLRENHVAQIAPAGAMRVWAEPETGGEGYIPLALSKRPKAEAVLEDIAGRFGLYVGRYAGGAVLGGSGSASMSRPAGPSVNFNGPVYAFDVDEFARKTAQKQFDAIAAAGLTSLGV